LFCLFTFLNIIKLDDIIYVNFSNHHFLLFIILMIWIYFVVFALLKSLILQVVIFIDFLIFYLKEVYYRHQRNNPIFIFSIKPLINLFIVWILIFFYLLFEKYSKNIQAIVSICPITYFIDILLNNFLIFRLSFRSALWFFYLFQYFLINQSNDWLLLPNSIQYFFIFLFFRSIF
jgi:hypothetical protein